MGAYNVGAHRAPATDFGAGKSDTSYGSQCEGLKCGGYSVGAYSEPAIDFGVGKSSTR